MWLRGVKSITKRREQDHVPEYFLYRSKNDPTKAITVAQNDDTTLYLPNAGSILSRQENQFESIEQIEEFLDDELEMIVRPQ